MNISIRIGLFVVFSFLLIGPACAGRSASKETSTPSLQATDMPSTIPVQPAFASTPFPPPTRAQPTLGATLQPTERAQVLLKLAQTNGDCDLPCALGITPGQTSYAEAKHIFEQMGWPIWEKAPQSSQSFETRSTYGDSSLTMLVVVHEKDGMVENLHMSVTGYKYIQLAGYYQLLNVLAREGIPSKAWIAIPPGLQGLSIPATSFNLFLYYQEKNMLLEYDGVARFSGDAILICPPRPWVGSPDVGPDTGDVGIYIGPGARPSTPEELTRAFGYEIIPFIGEEYQVETMLRMDIKAFYEDLLNRKESACYNIPKNVWP